MGSKVYRLHVEPNKPTKGPIKLAKGVMHKAGEPVEYPGVKVTKKTNKE